MVETDKKQLVLYGTYHLMIEIEKLLLQLEGLKPWYIYSFLLLFFSLVNCKQNSYYYSVKFSFTYDLLFYECVPKNPSLLFFVPVQHLVLPKHFLWIRYKGETSLLLGA